MSENFQFSNFLLGNPFAINLFKKPFFKSTSLSEKDEDSMIVVTELPFRVGFKKLLSKNYPARNLSTLEIYGRVFN